MPGSGGANLGPQLSSVKRALPAPVFCFPLRRPRVFRPPAVPLLRLPPGGRQPVRRADGGAAAQVAGLCTQHGGRGLQQPLLISGRPMPSHTQHPHPLPRPADTPPLPPPPPPSMHSLTEAGGLDVDRYAAALFAAFGAGFKGYRRAPPFLLLFLVGRAFLEPGGGFPPYVRTLPNAQLKAPWLSPLPRPPTHPLFSSSPHAGTAPPRPSCAATPPARPRPPPAAPTTRQTPLPACRPW